MKPLLILISLSTISFSSCKQNEDQDISLNVENTIKEDTTKKVEIHYPSRFNACKYSE